LFIPIFSKVSHIKAWLLDKTIFPCFFSNLSIIDKAGSAVQDINKASASSKLIFDRTSYKYSGSTLPISISEAISK